MLLSFIIPLYNCEEYISHCLDTILGSPIPEDEYEVIIVNDGSKDHGPEICEEYTKKYPYIRLINQMNKGASAARNLGLDTVQGDYIWFVDGDDAIISSLFDKAYQYLKTQNIDLLCFNHKKVGKEQTKEIWDFHEEKSLTGVEFLQGHYSNFIWNKIYSNKALKKKRFLDGTKNIEDMLFNMMTIIDMEHILCLPEFGYEYNCTNLSSTSRNPNLKNRLKLDQDSITILTTLNSFAEKQSDNNKKTVLKEYLNFSIAGHLYSLFLYYSPQRLRKRIKCYRQLGLYPVKKSDNKKGNRFLLLANHYFLFVSAMRLAIILKKLLVKNNKIVLLLKSISVQ